MSPENTPQSSLGNWNENAKLVHAELVRLHENQLWMLIREDSLSAAMVEKIEAVQQRTASIEALRKQSFGLGLGGGVLSLILYEVAKLIVEHCGVFLHSVITVLGG